jgi:hypothetical protein
MSTSATPIQVPDINVRWPGDATNPMEIDLLDHTYTSNYYAAKMPSLLANIYTCLTKKLIAMEKMVSESATRDCLATSAFPCLIAQYRHLLQQSHEIYKLDQENKSQFEKVLNDKYALLEQSTQNLACHVDRALIAIRNENQELFILMQNMVNS